MATTTDPVGPRYYKRGSTDVWDFIREQGLNFHLGNAIKYICRAGYKNDKLEDLRKAIHYLKNELEHEENLSIRTGEGIPFTIPTKEQPWEASDFISEKSDC